MRTMNACCCCHADSSQASTNKVCPDPNDDLATLAKHGIPLQAADLLAVQATMGQESFQIHNFTAGATNQPQSSTTSPNVSKEGNELTEWPYSQGTAYKTTADEMEKGTTTTPEQPENCAENAAAGEQPNAVQVQVVTVENFRESVAHDLNISGMRQICGGSINCCRR